MNTYFLTYCPPAVKAVVHRCRLRARYGECSVVRTCMRLGLGERWRLKDMSASSSQSYLQVQLVLRVAAFLGFWWGSYLLVANLLDSYRDFDPSYLAYFFALVILRPVLLLIWSVLLWLLAPVVARFVVGSCSKG